MIFKVKEYIMKNAFTLIELVFVIIVMGIISMFGADLYFQVYKFLSNHCFRFINKFWHIVFFFF